MADFERRAMSEPQLSIRSAKAKALAHALARRTGMPMNRLVEEALERYDPARMQDGWNTMPDGERVFFISTPSAGLWATREKLAGRTQD